MHSKINETPRFIFLIDGIGAVLTASLLGFLLPSLDTLFKMPVNILYSLSMVAVVFALYSLSCFFLFKVEQRLFLKMIMGANLTYCFVTAGFVTYFFNQLTPFDFVYFLGEIIIILALLNIERKTLKLLKP